MPTMKNERREIMMENPARKVSKEIKDDIINYYKKGYKLSQIIALIQEKHGLKLSPSTIRKYATGELEEIAEIENLDNEDYNINEFLRVVNEVLINKTKKKEGKTMAKTKTKGNAFAGLNRTISELTKAVKALNNPAKGGKRRKKKQPEGTIAKVLSDTLKSLWETDPALQAIREYLKRSVPAIVQSAWESEEAKDLRRKLKEEIRRTWASPEGVKLSEALSHQIKLARRTPGVLEGIGDIMGLDEIEKLATAVILKDAGLSEIAGIYEPAILGNAGTKLRAREIVRNALATPEGIAFIDELKYNISSMTSGTDLSEMGDMVMESIEGELRKFRKKRMGEEVHPVTPYIRSAWATLTPEERDRFVSSIKESINRAWTSEQGVKFRSLLEKRLGELFRTPFSQITTTEGIGAIERFVRLRQFTPMEQLEDLGRTLGLDYLLPGSVAVIGETWIHSIIRQIAQIPFGRDTDKVYWKRAISNLIAGAVHYSASNFLLAQLGRENEFVEKLRSAYGMFVLKDTLLNVLPSALFPASMLPASVKEVKTEQTTPTTSEFAVLPVDKLSVDENGNLVVPTELYDYYKALGYISETPFNVEEEEEDYISEEPEEIEEEELDIAVKNPEEEEILEESEIEDLEETEGNE